MSAPTIGALLTSTIQVLFRVVVGDLRASIERGVNPFLMVLGLTGV
jgi:hypothetical protein